jgi:hypothetical protein
MFSDNTRTHKEYHLYLSLFHFPPPSSFLDVPYVVQQTATQVPWIVQVVSLLLSSNAQCCHHQHFLQSSLQLAFLEE